MNAPRVAGYRLEECLSRADGAEVWRAGDAGGRQVALKLHGPESEDQAAAEMALLGVRHPGLVACLDANRLPGSGRIYTVTEYVEGVAFGPGTAGEGGGGAARRDGVTLAVQLLSAVGFLHELGLLHRDLKPDNVRLERATGRPVILDLGLSCPREEAAARPLAGTPRNMAPELLRGQAPSTSSDLWAVGLVLAEGLTGHLLFSASDPAGMAAEREAFAGLPSEAAARVGDADLIALLERLLHPDPAVRPADGFEAIASLPGAAPALVEGEEQAALVGKLSAALARHDSQRSARLDAVAGGAVWLAPFAAPETSLGQAMSQLVALAATVDAAPARLSARLAAAEVRTGRASAADLAGLIEALAECRPLVVSIGRAAAPDERAARSRDAVARQLADVRGLRLRAGAGLAPGEDIEVLREWIGRQPVLEERLEATPLREHGELVGALGALPMRGVVVRGAQGVGVHEGRLAAEWPVASEGDLDELLTGLDKELLSVLALCPRPLSAGACAEVLGRDVGAALAALVARGILRRERSQPEDLYSPADERLRRQLRAGVDVSAAHRVALAQRFDIEPLDAAAAVAVADVLGDHPPEDGDGVATRALIRRAAEQLRRVGRLERAMGLLRRGVKGVALEDVGARAVWLDLIDVTIRAADYDAALSTVEEARRRLPGDVGLTQREARIQILRGRANDAIDLLIDVDADPLADADAALLLETRADALDILGRSEEALRDMREAMRRQGARPHRRTMMIRARVGLIEEKLGHHDEAMVQLESSISMAKELGQDVLIGPMMSNLGRIVRVRGERRRGLAIQEEAARRMEMAGNSLGLAHALNGLGIGWLELGRVDTARRQFQRSLALAERIGDEWLQAVVHNNTGRALASEGRLDEAEEAFERSLTIRAARGDDRGQAIVLTTRGHWRLLRGRPAEARADIERARELLTRVTVPEYEIKSRLQLARIELYEGDREAARASAQAALEQARSVGHREEQLVARALLGRCGADDLEDVDATVEERGPHLAALLFTRAVGRERQARAAEADADFELAHTILGESPDGPVEAAGLVDRGTVDLARLEAAMQEPHLDYGVVGGLLVRLQRDGDRARLLVKLLDLVPLSEKLDALAVGQAKMEHQGEDMTALSRFAERVRNLERLAEITKALNSVHDTQQLLDLIVDAAIEMTGAARGFLILFQGSAQEFRVARNIDESDIDNPEFEISHSVSRQVMQSKQPILTDNAIDDPRLASARSISELKLLSILCVPLIIKERGIGSIYLDHPQVVSRFDEGHLELATGLAEQATIALENARLQEGLRTTNDELRASQDEVARLNDALQSRLDQREAELVEVRESLDASRRALSLKYDYSQIVTRSPKMHDVLDLMDRIIDTEYPVVIQGESGTGKELIARAIHFNGPRKLANFVSLNCAAIPEHLIESELFGHVRGAFTGADRDHRGLFEQADGGTLFLDEVGDMSLDVQKRLLRVLQEGTFLPVGGREERQVDVRVLSATNRDLRKMIPEGTFREDLFYRLAVAEVHLPPLRDRVEDVPLLIEHFVADHDGEPRTLDPEALRALERHTWPGNVRELQNLVSNLLMFDRESSSFSLELVTRVLSPAGPIDRGAAGGGSGVVGGGTPGSDPGGDESPQGGDGSIKDRLLAFEREQVLRALEGSQGNKAAAARSLGVGTRTFYKMLARLGLS